MFLGGLNPYEQKNPTESRFATNQRIFKQQQQQKGYYLLLHDFINLNQERKISPYLRESGEVHLGVHGILRRKKACAFQHFLEKKQKNPNYKPWQRFHQLPYLWTVSLLEELLSLKWNASQELTIVNLHTYHYS